MAARRAPQRAAELLDEGFRLRRGHPGPPVLLADAASGKTLIRRSTCARYVCGPRRTRVCLGGERGRRSGPGRGTEPSHLTGAADLSRPAGAGLGAGAGGFRRSRVRGAASRAAARSERGRTRGDERVCADRSGRASDFGARRQQSARRRASASRSTRSAIALLPR